MNAPHLTDAQRRELAALIVKYAYVQPQFEKDANILASFQKLPAILQGLARSFRGAPKPVRFRGTSIPTVPSGQTYSGLARAGKVRPQVRVNATDPNGLDLVLTPTAKGGTPRAAGAAIRDAMQAKLEARQLMLRGKRPTPDMIKKIQMLGDVGENPAAYADLPAAIKSTVASRVRGVVSPRMQFKKRVPAAAPQATTPAPQKISPPPPTAAPVEPPPLPTPMPVARPTPQAAPVRRPQAPTPPPAAPRRAGPAVRPALARPSSTPASTRGLANVELINPDVGGVVQASPGVATPQRASVPGSTAIDVTSLPWLNRAVK